MAFVSYKVSKKGSISLEDSREIQMVPLTKNKSCFVRVDKLALKQLTSAYGAHLGDVVSPTRIMDVLSYDALKTRKTLDIGPSFQTDGVQICLQLVENGRKTGRWGRRNSS